MVKKTNTSLPSAPIRRLMKKEGCSMVAADALDLLKSVTEQHIADVTRKANSYRKAAKRKSIMKEDVDRALKVGTYVNPVGITQD